MLCNVHESDSRQSQPLRTENIAPRQFHGKTIRPRPEPAERPVETTRLEYKAKPSRKSTVSKSSLHFPVQSGSGGENPDNDLQFVIEHWPILAPAVRAKIIALASGDQFVE
jgi:hypothetical protein